MSDMRVTQWEQAESAAHTVYLGLGANLGDRDATLRAALAALGELVVVAVVVAVDALGAAQSEASVAPTQPDQLTTQPATLLATHPIVRIERVSSVYDTAPLLMTEQPRFHNIVCMGQTWLAPLPLLHALKGVETQLGRVAGPRYGPRMLDIDILFYDDLTLQTPDLTIPHERIAERAFVLLPLAEIAPDLRHPTLGRDIRSLAADVAGADVRRVGRL